MKLCDFGFARTIPSNGNLTDYVATRWYRAPELLLGTFDYGKPVDMWAIGCIMAEMIDSQPLFPGESEIDQLYLIQKTLSSLTSNQQEIFQKNPRFIGLKFPEITRCETLEKRYLKTDKKAIDFLSKLLKMEPSERLTASEALQHPYLSDLYDRPQTTASASRTDSANARGRYAPATNSKNKRLHLISNPVPDNKKHFVKIKEDQSLSPPPAACIKDTQYNIPLDPIKSQKPPANANVFTKIRASPFANDTELKSMGIDRQKSKEGIRYNENPDGKSIRKKKSAFEDNQMFHIFEEDEEIKVSPRLKPMTIKKKTTKVFYPQEANYEAQMKNLRSGIFNRGVPRITSEVNVESDDISNHQSARQLPNIYNNHYHPEFKRGRIKEEDPDLGGGPQYIAAFQPDDFLFSRNVKNYNFEYKRS